MGVNKNGFYEVVLYQVMRHFSPLGICTANTKLRNQPSEKFELWQLERANCYSLITCVAMPGASFEHETFPLALWRTKLYVTCEVQRKGEQHNSHSAAWPMNDRCRTAALNSAAACMKHLWCRLLIKGRRSCQMSFQISQWLHEEKWFFYLKMIWNIRISACCIFIKCVCSFVLRLSMPRAHTAPAPPLC